MNTPEVNIVLPVYNEEKRLKDGIDKLLEYLKKHPEICCIITIMDNGSVDKTRVIAEEICENYKFMQYIHIDDKGIGIAFRTAVEYNTSPYIGYMDIDMSTDLDTLGMTYEIICSHREVGFINTSRYSRNSNVIGRKWYRNMISFIWIILLKLTLNMKASDSICGFKFFRKDIIDELMKESEKENDWFLMIEILLRAERKKVKIVELPVTWIFDKNTKVNIPKVTMNYLKGIWRLKRNGF